jgi:hypothetical protein
MKRWLCTDQRTGQETIWTWALAGLAAAVMTTLSSAQVLTFSDQTDAAGLTSSQISPLGPPTNDDIGGVAVADFNRDGWQDIFLPMLGSAPDRLFINNADGTFTDRATEWGVDATHIGSGAAIGDYDNDGLLDMFLASHGTPTSYRPDAHHLYRNLGDSFEDVANEAGVRMTSPIAYDGFGATFGDADLDGDLDLFVTGWQILSDGNRYFLNNGNGTFTDVTSTHIDPATNLIEVRGLSPQFVDMDGDRYPELLIAGDFGTSRYLINNGDGTFLEATASSGTGLDDYGMGQCVGDFNKDGQLDWYVTSIYGFWHNSFALGNMLYSSLGDHAYEQEGDVAGVDEGGWGWGTTAVDLDHDSDLDIVANNGWFQSLWLDQPLYIFLSKFPLDRFEESGEACNIAHVCNGRGLAQLDYDNDGDQDLLVCALDEPFKLFRNDLSGRSTNWLRVKLDTQGVDHIAPDGFGSKIEVTADGITQLDIVNTGASFLSQSEITSHFGLADALTVESVRVTWPNGHVTLLEHHPHATYGSNKTITIAYDGPLALVGTASRKPAPAGSNPPGPPVTQ